MSLRIDALQCGFSALLATSREVPPIPVSACLLRTRFTRSPQAPRPSPPALVPVRRRAGGIDSFPSTGCSPKLRPRPRNKEKQPAVDGQTGNLFPGCREGPHVVPCGALDPGYRHIPEDPVFGEGAGEEVFITFMVQRIGTETEAKKEVALSSSKTMFRA